MTSCVSKTKIWIYSPHWIVFSLDYDETERDDHRSSIAQCLAQTGQTGPIMISSPVLIISSWCFNILQIRF